MENKTFLVKLLKTLKESRKFFSRVTVHHPIGTRLQDSIHALVMKLLDP